MNGQSLLGASHAEALMALQSVETCARLTVCDGYNNILKSVSTDGALQVNMICI